MAVNLLSFTLQRDWGFTDGILILARLNLGPSGSGLFSSIAKACFTLKTTRVPVVSFRPPNFAFFGKTTFIRNKNPKRKQE